MGLSTLSPQIERLREELGAMGADNLALRLTHRYILQRRWNLAGANRNSGEFTPGISIRGSEFRGGLNVDIGSLPVLELLKGEGVGGILGADLLMMCDMVRFSGLNGPSPTMTLIKE